MSYPLFIVKGKELKAGALIGVGVFVYRGANNSPFSLTY